MSKKITGLIGTVAAVAMCDAAVTAVHAQPNPAETLRAQSYAELLEPIPNALAVLKADNQTRKEGARVQLADYYYHHHHHHHHHHHQYGYWYRPSWWYHHHHHHHHHNYGYWYRPYWYHHHHHHHHYYRDWDDR